MSIQINNLSYAYPQVQPNAEPVWVLDGVECHIAAGEFVAIMGLTGSGKSTLCLALNGIVPHSTSGTIGGTVTINGQNTKRATVAELAQTVGIVFQDPETQLFNMTVEAEIAFGLETQALSRVEMKQRIAWALSLVDMAEYRHHSPFELSGGQKQRVAIAAILAMKPPVLVLDEPTANLDPLGKQEVFAVVERLRQQEGITIVMVSHESEQIAAFAGRLLVLHSGKIHFDGDPATWFKTANTIGVASPQLSQLAQRLRHDYGTAFSFFNVEGGANCLQGWHFVREERFENVVSAESPQFQLTHLSFSYDQTSNAVDDLSLTIEQGEFIAIVGQNGSGKTTLTKLLNGLLRPTRGQILLNGQDIETQSIAQLARSVGYVFQNPDHMIFSPTVRAELAIGPRNLGMSETRVMRQVDEVLEQFNLVEYALQQPASLSFGLRRKVSVASVVAMQTPILILDEPTSGLDQRSSNELMTTLQERNRLGHTIIVITHDMQLVAEHVPRCLVMHKGQRLAHGTTRQVMGKSELLRQTRLEPPPITQLGARLGSIEPILTVDEFVERARPHE